ncbi:MoaD/ThiS family protein [Candidatus Poribacteria bacterium]|nr:MoaD/ThiS family protein [Candidatus Poribacteria bacterium]
MKIRVNFIGTLSKYAGVDSVDLALRDGACYGDLLAEIGNRYGSSFPKQCWDAEKNEFKPPISAIGPNGDIEAIETPLPENAEIHFLIPVSGGSEENRSKTKGKGESRVSRQKEIVLSDAIDLRRRVAQMVIALCHSEPSICHSEPSFCHSEPSLCHFEPSLCHFEPSLCHSERSEESLSTGRKFAGKREILRRFAPQNDNPESTVKRNLIRATHR